LVMLDMRTPTPHLPGRACVVQTLGVRTVRINRHAHLAHGCGGHRSCCKLLASTHWSFLTCARRRRIYPGERASCGHSHFALFDIISMRIAHTGAVAAVAAEDCWQVPKGPAIHARADAAATRASVRRADTRIPHRSTYFGTLSSCASHTRVQWRPLRLKTVGECPLVLAGLMTLVSQPVC